jgi:hypothetical protein
MTVHYKQITGRNVIQPTDYDGEASELDDLPRLKCCRRIALEFSGRRNERSFWRSH